MRLTVLAAAVASAAFAATDSAKPERIVLQLEPGEGWWGGMYDGADLAQPFGLRNGGTAELELRDGVREQASAPILLSTKGRWIWSDQAFHMSIADGKMTVTPSTTPIQHGKAGNSLRDAYQAVVRKFLPNSGKMPDEAFFSKPQYNTWIELNYHQNQKSVLEYAAKMKDLGFPPGIIMLDDTWQTDYGVWRFDPLVFPDPKAMVDKLHADGFDVMLWIIQYVSPDTREFRKLKEEGALVRTSGLGFEIDPAPAIFEWWDGLSAQLDFTSPAAVKWFRQQLQFLQKEYGIDGFKFDGSSSRWFDCPGKRVTAKPGASSGDLSEAYGNVCAEFKFNECKAWKGGGKPMVARLNDKPHSWAGLHSLIPEMIAAGLEGFQFVCPDMIGGGQLWSFTHGTGRIEVEKLDHELFVRSAQVQALCPMMQFSLGPWHILNDVEMAALKKTMKLRDKFAPFITNLAKQCAEDGQPMLRSMDYVFPNCGYETVVDQFMMGDTLLVAPVVEKGQTSRTVLIPAGTWVAEDGSEVVGPRTITVAAPLDCVPHFTKK